MKINVKITPNAKRSGIIEEQGVVKVKVNAPAKEGKANKDLIKMLSDYFSVPKSRVKILKGENLRNKVVDIIRK
ncbi:MAG: DUF167 domain-containing protein [Candidatus Kaelpia aquatica]|nr:DUF167 domain-containing protein [Candidatus Kaelpia aquatica]